MSEIADRKESARVLYNVTSRWRRLINFASSSTSGSDIEAGGQAYDMSDVGKRMDSRSRCKDLLECRRFP
jgi:hypothetical protein